MNDQHLPEPWIREEALAGDASTRCYSRLWDTDGGTAVMVRYPRDLRSQIRRDLEVRSWCAEAGLRVPSLLEHSHGNLWAVVEDLGPSDAAATLEAAKPPTRLDLCRKIIAPLITLAGLPTSGLPSWNLPLDGSRMRWELAGFELWFIRHHRGSHPAGVVGDWLDRLAAAIADHPTRVCHRDFHLNNLFFLDGNEVAIIDYQDILVGPDTYDVVSLLNERSMPDLLDDGGKQAIETIWARETSAEEGWQARLQQVKLQRALKVLGTFSRLEATGDPAYGLWLRSLARALHPDLKAADAPSELTDLLLDL